MGSPRRLKSHRAVIQSMHASGIIRDTLIRINAANSMVPFPELVLLVFVAALSIPQRGLAAQPSITCIELGRIFLTATSCPQTLASRDKWRWISAG